MGKDFQKIVSISDRMLIKARSEEWDELAEMENERGALMTSFFSKSIAPSAKAYVADGIRLILEKDREIMRLGVIKRKALRSSLKKMGQNKSAVRAYAASA